MTIDEMLATPGMYEVEVYPGDPRYTMLLEVEADGTCHQLTHALERDGVLSRNGWSPLTNIVRRVYKS